MLPPLPTMTDPSLTSVARELNGSRLPVPTVTVPVMLSPPVAIIDNPLTLAGIVGATATGLAVLVYRIYQHSPGVDVHVTHFYFPRWIPH